MKQPSIVVSKYVLCFILFISSCKDKAPNMQLINELNAATLQKTTDSNDLAAFKLENSDRFRRFDSLKIDKITVEQQKAHDSLFQKGVSLAMKFVKDKMKIDDLQKEQ